MDFLGFSKKNKDIKAMFGSKNMSRKMFFLFFILPRKI